ncbi:MAG: 3-dehydroquinate synthase [Bacteroidia bacterium]|nr:3-dehydroquinate synthase [Bacteroidia bacterium]
MEEIIITDKFKKLKNELDKISISLIICDKNTYKYCFPLLFSSSKKIPVYVINGGEKSKSIKVLTDIYKIFILNNISRNSIIINLGGGVVTDIGGFAASTFKRGLNYINIPTTLIGMTDAAIGGKTGINFNNLKNYIGTFCMPQKTIIYTDFLETLPEKQLKSGFAEMIKHGIIYDKNYFLELANLKTNLQNDLSENKFYKHIKSSVNIKSEIVKVDFKEENFRKILNFGHTVGHAIESYLIKRNIPHGYCVAAGMICESYISLKKGLLEENTYYLIEKTILKFFNPLKFEVEQINDIAKLTLKDKKNENLEINCVLLSDFEKPVLSEQISIDNIIESLKYYTSLCR